jgi:hypothetical protein
VLVLVLLLLLLLLQLFDGQPLQLMMKDLASGHPMLHLTVWHRRMLQHTAAKAHTASCGNGAAAAAAAAADSEDDVAALADCG